MTKVIISLLAVLLVFANYGDATAKFMSIHGDINFAMFEHTLDETDTVGFVYDNQYGNYALNSSYCNEATKGESAFQVQSDCTVQAQISVTKTPSDADYKFIREKNFPETETASNFMVGRRDDPGYHTSAVLLEGVAYVFSDIHERVHEKRSKIWCNDKSNRESKELFTFWNSNELTVIFRKNYANEYDQTMKCLAATYDEQNRRPYIARFFTVVISNRRNKPFTIIPINLDSHTARQHLAVTPEVEDEIDNTIKTKFVFRAEITNGCPPKINMESVEEEHNSISFIYNRTHFKMPAIESVGSFYCGIAREIPTDKPGSLFVYWCSCY